ncbi:cytochrome P450 [Streptomyces sp. NPDC047002]|uniref:cytochrome P450 n=1 Tax=Streptomyces sp. NPDC047002 TaxID=3155475 RepID=UPI0034542439
MLEMVVTPSGLRAWRVERYADVRRVLSETDTFSSRPGHLAHVVSWMDPESPVVEGDFSRMDGPAHRRLRGVLGAEMTAARRTKEFAERLDVIAEAEAERLSRQDGPVDLVTAYCRPLALTALVHLLALPEDRVPLLTEAAESVLNLNNDADRVAAGIAPMLAYVFQLVQERRQAPQEDILSRMLTRSEASGEPLTDGELTAVAGALFANGYATTAGSVAQCVLALLTRPAARDAFVAGLPAVAPATVAELLRHQGQGVQLLRSATRGTVIAGTAVEKGDYLLADVGSASFDPARYPDPYAFDLERNPADHLTFGHGAHRCPAERFALLEIEVGLRALFTRFPTLRLAVPADELAENAAHVAPGPRGLPVGW